MASWKGLKARIRRLTGSDERRAALLMERFSVFTPSSYNYWEYPHLTYSGANGFPDNLRNLMSTLGHDHVLSRMRPEEFADGRSYPSLATAFDASGSDKARNGYHDVYGEIIARLTSTLTGVRILEIGLGTNNPALISTMGASGQPGASIRAFRDYCPKASIYGADIDENILFSESRIVTAKVDQLDPESFKIMVDRLAQTSFDLIIDDGLHSPAANLNTLSFGISAVSAGGWIVIEDIPERALPVWHVVHQLIDRNRFEVRLIEAVNAFMFVVNRLR